MVVVVGVRVVITVGFYSYYIASTSVKANSLIANNYEGINSELGSLYKWHARIV